MNECSILSSRERFSLPIRRVYSTCFCVLLSVGASLSAQSFHIPIIDRQGTIEPLSNEPRIEHTVIAQTASAGLAERQNSIQWPAGLPIYDHVVIVVEENKNYDEIIGNTNAPYINNVLLKEGANLTQMFAEEHHSEGNYFWLFSGDNQNVEFDDQIPTLFFAKSNLGQQLIADSLTFKGYSEDLPTIGSLVARSGHYARKHVPWISFANVPHGKTAADSSNLRFKDFPSDYTLLPTVSFVIPNLIHDMHDGSIQSTISVGDKWLKENLDKYYEWAKLNNSLLILTFDENSETSFGGLTDPADVVPAKRNRIATILAGAHVEPGEYAEEKGVTHVNLLRTLEAMYKLNRSGKQQENATKAGITDDFVVRDIFATPSRRR